MTWDILFHRDFEAEFGELAEVVQDEALAQFQRLAEFGPKLGRPHADVLKGSHYNNLKELRFKADGGVWRVAFAFDPNREAILLVAGNKSGVSESRFYRQLIRKADNRFTEHLEQMTNGGD